MVGAGVLRPAAHHVLQHRFSVGDAGCRAAVCLIPAPPGASEKAVSIESLCIEIVGILGSELPCRLDVSVRPELRTPRGGSLKICLLNRRRRRNFQAGINSGAGSLQIETWVAVHVD